MNNQEIPQEIKEYVLKALDTTYGKASDHIENIAKEKGNNKVGLSTGVQNFLVDFIVQLLLELGVVKAEESQKIREGIEQLISKYKNSKGEA